MSASPSVVVITGANSGCGYSLVELLIEKHLAALRPSQDGHLSTTHTTPQIPTIIVLACRSPKRANTALDTLISKYFVGQKARKAFPVRGLDDDAAREEFAKKMLQLLIVDLSVPADVFRAAKELADRFEKIDALVMNAGVLHSEGIRVRWALYQLATRPDHVFRTGGDIVIQPVGETTPDSGGTLGEVFAANVLGHYILLREIEDLLSAAGGSGKVLFNSSSTPVAESVDLNDFQALESHHPYEHSKRLMDLAFFALRQSYLKPSTTSPVHLRSTNAIHLVLCDPGALHSGITGTLGVPTWILFVVFVLLRFVASGLNFTGRNGATSLFWALSASIGDGPHANTRKPLWIRRDAVEKYHADVDGFGRTFVKVVVPDESRAVVTRCFGDDEEGSDEGEREGLRRRRKATDSGTEISSAEGGGRKRVFEVVAKKAEVQAEVKGEDLIVVEELERLYALYRSSAAVKRSW
ncbi:hypothetical protein BJ742DRAFT_835537 [Cladochytrium replicatum]|nr:hypothetical protein BJ742DRAFT_835537 [Cladochytrium replicatum]